MEESRQGLYESRPQEEAKGEAHLVKVWLDALGVAGKEEETWRKRGAECVGIYRDEKDRQQRRFNILYAITETLSPAVYNSTPIPDIRPRFGDQFAAQPQQQPAQQPPQPGMPPEAQQPPQPPPTDPTKVAARVLEKAISFGLDAYDFDATMHAAVKDVLLPGRAVTRVRYEPSFAGDPLTDENGKPQMGEDGEPIYPIAYQQVTCEHVPWKSFRRGPGRMWGDVPWIAFEHFLTRDQLRKLNPKLAEKVNLDAPIDGVAMEDKDRPPDQVFMRACVWEIWDKEKREVVFIAPSFKDKPLRVEPDPLKLQGFLPIVRPLYALETTDSLVPVPLYWTYRDQAEELDKITRRITALVAVMKWRGLYAASEETSGNLSSLKDADDGDLLPATEFMSITAQGGGLDKAIWLMPVKEVAEVLSGLYQQREAIKQVIYEITGVADILRGSTKASETATAQEIKAQWGSLRIQRIQAEVQRYVRDIFRLKAELIAEHFDPQVLSMMTGEQVTPEVMQILKSDVMRSYRIDVETDSTVRADLQRRQENIAQFVQGTAQYIAAVGPAVQAGQMPAEVAAELFGAFASVFKLGRKAEDALDRMSTAAQQPQPEKPDPEAQKAQAEMQRMQMQAQIDQTKAQADMQAKQQEMQMKMQLMQADMAAKQADLEIKRAELDLKREEIALKQQDMQITSQAKQAEMAMNLQHKQEESAISLQSKRDMAEIQKQQAAKPKADAA